MKPITKSMGTLAPFWVGFFSILDPFGDFSSDPPIEELLGTSADDMAALQGDMTRIGGDFACAIRAVEDEQIAR